jgi:hypothetical protein
MRLNLFLPLLAACLAGCATLPPRPVALRVTTDALLTQRGVLTIHGRQFPLNGYLALSQTSGMRLIMTAAFGQVLADVLIKPDGTVYLMRPNPVLRRAWIERFVARDLECLFGHRPGLCPAQATDANHFVVNDRGYTLELQTVDTKAGLQLATLFDETKAALK